MDERCGDAVGAFACGDRAPWTRCGDCGHVLSVHGRDGICDLCATERKVRAK